MPVPTWMVKAHPDVLAETVKGRGIYGARQIMDITHPVYLFYAERVIRELMKRTAHRKCVIGFQLDNETKYYGTAGKNVQEQFVKYIREKFHDDLDALNYEFGLDIGATESTPGRISRMCAEPSTEVLAQNLRNSREPWLTNSLAGRRIL